MQKQSEEQTGAPVKEGKTNVETWFTNNGTKTKCGELTNALCVGITNGTNTSDIKKLGVIKLKTPVNITTQENGNDVKRRYTCLIFDYGYIKTRLTKAGVKNLLRRAGDARLFLKDLWGYTDKPSSIASKVDVAAGKVSRTLAVVVPWEALGEAVKSACKCAKCSVFWACSDPGRLWAERMAGRAGPDIFWKKRKARQAKRRDVEQYLQGWKPDGWWRDKNVGAWFWWDVDDSGTVELRATYERPVTKADHGVPHTVTCGDALCVAGETRRIARLKPLIGLSQGFLYRGQCLSRGGRTFGEIIGRDSEYWLCALEDGAVTSGMETNACTWDYGFESCSTTSGLLMSVPDAQGDLVFAEHFITYLGALNYDSMVSVLSAAVGCRCGTERLVFESDAVGEDGMLGAVARRLATQIKGGKNGAENALVLLQNLDNLLRNGGGRLEGMAVGSVTRDCETYLKNQKGTLFRGEVYDQNGLVKGEDVKKRIFDVINSPVVDEWRTRLYGRLVTAEAAGATEKSAMAFDAGDLEGAERLLYCLQLLCETQQGKFIEGDYEYTILEESDGIRDNLATMISYMRKKGGKGQIAAEWLNLASGVAYSMGQTLSTFAFADCSKS